MFNFGIFGVESLVIAVSTGVLFLVTGGSGLKNV